MGQREPSELRLSHVGVGGAVGGNILLSGKSIVGSTLLRLLQRAPPSLPPSRSVNL